MLPTKKFATYLCEIHIWLILLMANHKIDPIGGTAGPIQTWFLNPFRSHSMSMYPEIPKQKTQKYCKI